MKMIHSRDEGGLLTYSVRMLVCDSKALRMLSRRRQGGEGLCMLSRRLTLVIDAALRCAREIRARGCEIGLNTAV